MEVLFVASECFPFVKTGGLADVVGSLPSELLKLGVDARVVIPKYKDIPAALLERMTFKKRITVSLGWRFQHCGIEQLEYNGVTYYFLENEYYFAATGYTVSVMMLNGCVFRAVLKRFLPGFKPGILHCRDWHKAGQCFKVRYQVDPFYQGLRTLYHSSINYRAIFPSNYWRSCWIWARNISAWRRWNFSVREAI